MTKTGQPAADLAADTGQTWDPSVARSVPVQLSSCQDQMDAVQQQSAATRPTCI